MFLSQQSECRLGRGRISRERDRLVAPRADERPICIILNRRRRFFRTEEPFDALRSCLESFQAIQMKTEIGAGRKETGRRPFLVSELFCQLLAVLEDVFGSETVGEGKGDLFGTGDVILGSVIENDRLWLYVCVSNLT